MKQKPSKKPIKWNGKYEKMFLRMMGKTFATIIALIIIMFMIGIPSLVIRITSGVMLVISLIVKMFYWNYLEGLEVKEMIGKVV